ncbi:50S ribosomal protein L17 [candidate division TA06 bacterium]|uniref:Large ribosomal subunit protein bL17 n=1 Tax=candidate division TA06 bacterium TaxID=2250710 RepID=A0A523UWW3_UNCT6|nr:MAG: 50S ribosomal protein L17 [candidate division TA06 bacterium]
MRHLRRGKKLGRTMEHRKALISNLTTALFAKESIITTLPKAWEARRTAERMISFALRGDLAARRHVLKTVKNESVVKKLFEEIAPRFTGRPGGYTRILKLGRRKGDGAETAILELVSLKPKEGKKQKRGRRKKEK